jgi:hypothetical protein
MQTTASHISNHQHDHAGHFVTVKRGGTYLMTQIVLVTYTEGHERNTALGVLSAVGAAGGSLFGVKRPAHR